MIKVSSYILYCMVVQLKASLIGQFCCADLSLISQLVPKTSVIGQFNCNTASLIGQLCYNISEWSVCGVDE